MSVYAGPNLSENGIITYLDAGNKNSYPGTGTTWTDLSANKKTATLTGMSYTSPYFYNFTGVSGNRINVNVDSALASLYSFGTGNFTYSFWVYFNSLTNTSYQALLSFGSGNSNLVRFYTTTQIDIIGGVSGTTQQIQATVPTLTAGVWTNIVIVRQSGTVTAYVNGVAGTPVSNFTISYTRTSGELFYLGNPGFAGQQLLGNLSTFSAYNVALTATEIRQNFNALRSRFGV